MFTKIQSGNLRVIAKDMIGLQSEWQNHFNSLKTAIGSSPKVDIYGAECYVFFSDAPCEELGFDDLDAQCAIAVTGYEDFSKISDEEEGFESIDIYSGEIFKLEEKFDLIGLERNELIGTIIDGYNWLKSNGHEISDHWRLEIRYPCETYPQGYVDIQFFV